MLKEVYKKHNSFFYFKGKNVDILQPTISRILIVKEKKLGLSFLSSDHQKLLDKAIKDLNNKADKTKEPIFQLSEHVIAEIASLPDKHLLKYIVHRYRYEIFPQTKKLDNYPPCLQIEPSSICNFRCVFCFETDATFTNKKNGYMVILVEDSLQNALNFKYLPYISKRIRATPEFIFHRIRNLIQKYPKRKNMY